MSTIIYNKTSKSTEIPRYNQKFPYLARLKKRVLLNKPSSTKKTFHIELDIKGSNILFKEGDAVAILPENPENLVNEALSFLNYSESPEIFHHRSETKYPLLEFIKKHANLLKVTPSLLKALSEISDSPELLDLTKEESKEARKTFIENHDVLTCLNHFKISGLNPESFCNTLSPLLPRFYSVASSQKVHPNELHLLVATFSYEVQGAQREGIGSDFLCYQTKEDESLIPLYLQSNPGFFLPQDPHTRIIMVGPGTGVAAFRSFIQERISSEVPTKNWLFFGERNRLSDFYYEEEFNSYVKKGLLRIDAAFSRDQKEKFYVQHLMLKHSKEIADWLNDGAYLYICGDARHMAKDVNATLLNILQKENKLSEQSAKELFHSLRKEKRLQSDVY